MFGKHHSFFTLEANQFTNGYLAHWNKKGENLLSNFTHPFCFGLKCRDQTQHWEFVSAPTLYLCIVHPKRENLEGHQEARNFTDNVQPEPEYNFRFFLNLFFVKERFEKKLTWQTGLMWTAWEWKLLWNSFSDLRRTARPAWRKEKANAWMRGFFRITNY